MTNKKLLIFGGTGYLGGALISHYAHSNDVMIYSRDEAKHWNMLQKFPQYRIRSFIGDCRDEDRVKDALLTFEPDIVFIVSALKQIPFCEIHPYESVQTNIYGVYNVIHSCAKIPTLEKCLFISSDKACSPLNVYGMCKAISEKTMTAMSEQCNNQTKFLTVRYGNVIDSTGSVLPLFRMQCRNKTNITITSPEMTRFIMIYEDSLRLIDHALDNGNSGDIWIPILSSMRVKDLADIFSEKFGVKISDIGIRPGEKIHEELINVSEGYRTNRFGDYYVIKPCFTNLISSVTKNVLTYDSSQDIFTKEQLSDYLNKHNLLYI